MKYNKKKTFEAAEAHLKEKQNIKPQQENFYSKDWFNQSHGSRRAAVSAYKNAMKNWKAKAKK